MPFAQGDIFTATLDDNQVFQRPGASSSRSSSLFSSIHSSQFFIISFLLFVGTALQAYFAPASSVQFAVAGTDTFQSFAKDAILVISDMLSPLMLLAIGVGMAGTLCRGLEVVIESAAFRGRAL
ncbi:SubName: Full=Uncharacterized protein {ECO:0000313/EMBL:CCA75646.1} [Serendipita indica DSM 11827]|nr:SubName: Full=Uncharacterized protein {ECO:0000313/EMBL:CCA75646.1} [Serendipita indica DSM 11827]